MFSLKYFYLKDHNGTFKKEIDMLRNLRIPKQTPSVSNYPVDSRSQITIRRRIYQRRFLFLFTFDLPDKRPWPYRKPRRLSDRTKRRKAVDRAGRKNRKDQEERRDEPRPTHDFWLCLKPPGNRISRFLPLENVERRREGFRVVK